MMLAPLSAGFQSLPPLPTSKMGPSGADSWVGGFVYVLGSHGSLQWALSCEAGSFSRCRLKPQGVFNQWFKALFPSTGALGLRGLFHSPFDPPGLSARECGICQPLLAPPAAHSMASLGHPATALPWRESSIPCCPSLPLLPVWMNVSSLTPRLSDLHTVRFSVSSGFFCFLFKFVVLLLLVEGGTGYLPMPSSWPDCYSVFKLVNLFFLQYLFNLLSVPSILVFISRS